jgi:DNA mismatch endonuclease (patch repair protein)
MADVVDAATRSRMMANITSKNTKPELLVRHQLHARGLRYVLGGAGLPGRPDIVFPKWKVAVFVHGCFWHWHACHLSRLPSSNRKFWRAKLGKNQTRDTVSLLALLSAGWRVATIWECALRGSVALHQLNRNMDALSKWVKSPGARTRALEFPDAPFH